MVEVPSHPHAIDEQSETSVGVMLVHEAHPVGLDESLIVQCAIALHSSYMQPPYRHVTENESHGEHPPLLLGTQLYLPHSKVRVVCSDIGIGGSNATWSQVRGGLAAGASDVSDAAVSIGHDDARYVEPPSCFN